MRNMTNKQNCPLCDHPATFVSVDFGREKKFSCPNCKVFVIHHNAAEYIAELPKQKREEISIASSECPEGMVLLILNAHSVSEVTYSYEAKSNWS
jgi:hypothetical protein